MPVLNKEYSISKDRDAGKSGDRVPGDRAFAVAGNDPTDFRKVWHRGKLVDIKGDTCIPSGVWLMTEAGSAYPRRWRNANRGIGRGGAITRIATGSIRMCGDEGALAKGYDGTYAWGMNRMDRNSAARHAGDDAWLWREGRYSTDPKRYGGTSLSAGGCQN